MPWERDIYVQMVIQFIKDENERRKREANK